MRTILLVPGLCLRVVPTCEAPGRLLGVPECREPPDRSGCGRRPLASQPLGEGAQVSERSPGRRLAGQGASTGQDAASEDTFRNRGQGCTAEVSHHGRRRGARAGGAERVLTVVPRSSRPLPSAFHLSKLKLCSHRTRVSSPRFPRLRALLQHLGPVGPLGVSRSGSWDVSTNTQNPVKGSALACSRHRNGLPRSPLFLLGTGDPTNLADSFK